MVHVDVSLGGPQQLIEMLSCPMCMNVNALWAGGTLLDKPYVYERVQMGEWWTVALTRFEWLDDQLQKTRSYGSQSKMQGHGVSSVWKWIKLFFLIVKPNPVLWLCLCALCLQSCCFPVNGFSYLIKPHHQPLLSLEHASLFYQQSLFCRLFHSIWIRCNVPPVTARGENSILWWWKSGRWRGWSEHSLLRRTRTKACNKHRLPKELVLRMAESAHSSFYLELAMSSQMENIPGSIIYCAVANCQQMLLCFLAAQALHSGLWTHRPPGLSLCGRRASSARRPTTQVSV